MENPNRVRISNDVQYIENKIVRRNAVSDLSTMVTCRARCHYCSIDYRLCEFGTCQNNMPTGFFS